MKVKNLIAYLQTFNPELPVVVEPDDFQGTGDFLALDTVWSRIPEED